MNSLLPSFYQAISIWKRRWFLFVLLSSANWAVGWAAPKMAPYFPAHRFSAAFASLFIGLIATIITVGLITMITAADIEQKEISLTLALRRMGERWKLLTFLLLPFLFLVVSLTLLYVLPGIMA